MKKINSFWILYILPLFFLRQAYCFSENTVTNICVYDNYAELSFLETLNDLNNSLKNNLIDRNMEAAAKGSVLIIDRLNFPYNDSLTVADSYYYVGMYYAIINNLTFSNQYLHLAVSIRERLKAIDGLYAKALYNLGGNYFRLGNFDVYKDLLIKSLDIEKQIYGDENNMLLSTYGGVISAYIALKDFKQAAKFAEIAIRIAESDSPDVDDYYKAFLYHNVGVLYSAIGDYYKSMIFFEKVDELYMKIGIVNEEGYINVLNNLSYLFNLFGFTEKAEIYKMKSINMAMQEYSIYSYYTINTYAADLAKSGNEVEGEKVLYDLVKNVEKKFGSDSQPYYEALSFYADYLREFNIDDDRAFNFYKKCVDFLDNNKDSFVRFFVKTGYATMLSQRGNYKEAITMLQSLLFESFALRNDVGIFDNPSIDSINIDKDYLSVFREKYKILRDYYRKTQDVKILEASINTAELLINIIDNARINISNEASRLILGSDYRDLYIDIIGDLLALHKLTSNAAFMVKAFRYIEKSKIATLLTATRELTAAEYHIPEELANEERNLQVEISILNDRIAGKSEYGVATDELVAIWRQNLFNAIRRRDMLIKTFEDKYPDYYEVKYNTNVASPDEIVRIIGRKGNYLSYVASDNVIFIGVVNRKNFNIMSINVDSSFYNRVQKFRDLLIAPDFNNVSNEIQEYKTIGSYLYNTLILPTLPYLTSDNLTISPDNLLSYIPFEVIPVNGETARYDSYRNIDYMMNKFDISYTYSATLESEIRKRKLKTNNSVIAFAPKYQDTLKIENILYSRQQSGDILLDLPFARSEAEYVSKLLKGKLYSNEAALKSRFQSEATKYGILHLAMHTIVNDEDPMYSTLVFSPDSLGIDDRFLRTFEIYGIPLKASMVVLSSCNTGTGQLYSGEGILSLARGVVFAGSESVVMSMWKIDDRSGSDIVKLYYDYLKKGYSKSMSLKKARIKFINSADQLRSHPYFWGTLAVYGVNDALFSNKMLMVVVGGSMLIIIIVAIAYYQSKRRYS